VRSAPPPARRTSRQDPRGRTDSRHRSMAGSGMSSSTQSCSPQPLRHRSWPTVGAGSTTRSGRTRPSRGVRPWRQLNRSCRITTTTHSHKAWTDKGGHVSLTPGGGELLIREAVLSAANQSNPVLRLKVHCPASEQYFPESP